MNIKTVVGSSIIVFIYKLLRYKKKLTVVGLEVVKIVILMNCVKVYV